MWAELTSFLSRTVVVAVLLSPLLASAQDTSPLTLVAPNLGLLSSIDGPSRITYSRFVLSSSSTLDLTKPTLIAQCTRDPSGKFSFELFLNFGNVTDLSFHPPWSSSPRYPERPPMNTINITMQFLGYVKEKPVTRQFEVLRVPAGQFRYNQPGLHSHNLEDVSYYLQYLRALPTLRVSYGTNSADFFTESLLARMHADPLCQAAGV